jgi:CheY-like chemotaxis protein/anti-sigma regulatory factor (Ser/Thr protein kinase)
VIDPAIETARPLIDVQDHELVVSLPPGPVRLRGDRVRLAQVFSNLLNNAAKYTAPGGRIVLSARVEGEEVVVDVVDNGSGIAPEMVPKVFDLFVQADRTLDRSQGGLGIGLTLVRRLVELHGGRVSAASTGAGQGSTFTVRLPVLAAPDGRVVPATKVGRGPAEAAGAPVGILVVDDNADNAQSLAMLLRLLGHDVHVAGDGPSALEQAARHRPRLVLLDIGLPGMDGYEVARRLRAREPAGGPFLVAMTGYGQPEDRRRSAEAGFSGHLVKPVEIGELEALLESLRTPEAAHRPNLL